MGSTMKPTIFNENVAKALRTWHHTARKHIKKKRHLANVTPLPSQPGTPLNGTSPAHLLHYYKGELDSVHTSPGISKHTTEEEDVENYKEHSPYHEASSWSHQGRNDDTMDERWASTQSNNHPQPIPQSQLFQQEIDIESSADFSFSRNCRK